MPNSFRAVGPALMTLPGQTSAFRPLAALFLLLAVLIGGTIEAAACEFEPAAFEQLDISSNDGDDPSPGDSTAKHGVCAHGHCHHGAQSIDSNSDTASIPAAASVHFRRAMPGLSEARLKLVKEPPRA